MEILIQEDRNKIIIILEFINHSEYMIHECKERDEEETKVRGRKGVTSYVGQLF